jgi:hypothetical protein
LNHGTNLNLVLGNLTTLRQALLPESWQAQTERDSVIAALGRGVAGMFEEFCDRKFGREEDAVEYFERDKEVLVLARYPLEAKPEIDLRGGNDGSWQPYTENVANWSPLSGIVTLNGSIGDEWSLIRVTYTGGFWVDETEDGVATPEEGLDDATPVPAALQRAWLDQCRHHWTAADLFANKGSGTLGFAQMDFLPTVRQTLERFRRMTV